MTASDPQGTLGRVVFGFGGFSVNGEKMTFYFIFCIGNTITWSHE